MTELDGKTLADYYGIIGKSVHVIMDRPIGAKHPKHKGLIYPINYGYAEGIMGGDGEGQDVYVLGEREPLKTFDGVVIAVIHRYNDVETKWVAAKPGEVYTPEQIASAIDFQEHYYKTTVVM